jgi:hypothetical protein
MSHGRWVVGFCAGMIVVIVLAVATLSNAFILLVIIPCLLMLAGMAYMVLTDRDDRRR